MKLHGFTYIRKDPLEELNGFIHELENIRDHIHDQDEDALKHLMITSTQRRGFFDKKQR